MIHHTKKFRRNRKLEGEKERIRRERKKEKREQLLVLGGERFSH